VGASVAPAADVSVTPTTSTGSRLLTQGTLLVDFFVVVTRPFLASTMWLVRLIGRVL
jgi:hypothetical protein